MQKNEQSLLLIHRENYIVPKGQEQTVHCKIAKMDSNGNIIEGVRLVHFGLKKFETTIKDNLELMGYTVEILHHPMGRYSNSVIKSKDVEIAKKDEEINALNEEIARMRKELAEATKPKVEEEAPLDLGMEVEGEKKKGGRPKKEA